MLIRLTYILHRTIVCNQNGKLLFVTTQKQVQQNVKVSFVAFLDNLQKKLINKFSFLLTIWYFYIFIYLNINKLKYLLENILYIL